MTPPFQRGEFVRLTIETWSIVAFVALASPNGRSLIVMFDGAAPIGGGGVMVGSLALIQDDADGVFRELTFGTPVDVARRS